jgi:hypothetical protein
MAGFGLSQPEVLELRLASDGQGLRVLMSTHVIWIRTWTRKTLISPKFFPFGVQYPSTYCIPTVGTVEVQ